MRTYDEIPKFATDQGDNYTTVCLLDYVHFKSYYEVIAIDISKQEALYTDLKAIQEINFTINSTHEEQHF